MLAEKPSYRWRRCNGIQYVRFLGQVNKSQIYSVCMCSRRDRLGFHADIQIIFEFAWTPLSVPDSFVLRATSNSSRETNLQSIFSPLVLYICCTGSSHIDVFGSFVTGCSIHTLAPPSSLCQLPTPEALI